MNRENAHKLAHYLISDDELSNWLATSSVIADLSRNSEGTSYLPTLILLEPKPTNQPDDEHPLTICPLLIENYNDFNVRHAAIRLIGEETWKRQTQVVAAVFVTEVWSRQFKSEEVADRREVAAYDDKQEALMIAARTIDGRDTCMFFPIERDENQVISLGIPRRIPSEVKLNNEILISFYQGYLKAMCDKARKPKGFGPK